MMNLRFAVTLGVTGLVAACTQPGGGGAGISPASTSPAPTSATTNCRLPIWSYDWSTNVGTAYYLPGSGGQLIPAQPPVTANNTEESYVSSVDQWIPVRHSLVSPDAKRFANNDVLGSQYRVHVIDLASGMDRVISQGSTDTGFEAIAFEADGVYAGRPSNGPGSAPGLWLLDPSTGAAKLIDPAQRWQFISRGYAYRVVPNPSNPVAGQGGPIGDSLVRLDLRDRSAKLWFSKPGEYLDVLGFDSGGQPVVLVGGSTLADAFVISGQDQAEQLPGERRGVTFFYVYPSLIATRDGFWFAADQGVFRFTSQSGFQQLWNNPRVKTVVPLIAGPCT